MSYGGSAIASGANVMLEVQDTTFGATDVSTVLYDGAVTSAPALAIFAAIDSTNFIGSIANITITEAGAVWVTSQDPGGNTFTRKLGLATQGADARIERTGKLHFYASAVPVANEIITVTYRTPHRAVARIASAASMAAEAKGPIPGTARWIGSVVSPQARSSADCENAAFTLLALATSRAAAWSGKYTAYNLQSPQDVWPGDVLAVNAVSTGMNANLVVHIDSFQRDFDLQIICGAWLHRPQRRYPRRPRTISQHPGRDATASRPWLQSSTRRAAPR